MTFYGWDIGAALFPPILPEGLPTFDAAINATDITDSTITLSWGTPTSIVPTDYAIQYRLSPSGNWIDANNPPGLISSFTITVLTSSTDYDIRIRATDGSTTTLWSAIITVRTFISVPFFQEPYAWFNVNGVTAVNLASYVDTNAISRNGVPLTTLNAGQVGAVTSAVGDVFTSNDPFYASGIISNSTTPLASRVSAGTTFTMNATRNNPQTFYFYAFEDATITLSAGATTLDSATVVADTAGTLTTTFLGTMTITSTGLMSCYFSSNGWVDAKVMVPDSSDIVGFPSGSGRLSTSDSSTLAVSGIHSNSVTQAFNANNTVIVTLTAQGTASLYQCEALRLTSSNGTIHGSSVADANGSAAATFLPTTLMQTQFIVPGTTDYAAFASLSPGTIDVLNAAGTTIDTLTLARTGGNANAPYRVYDGTSRPAGTRFSSSTPVAAYYQEAITDDETLLLGFN